MRSGLTRVRLVLPVVAADAPEVERRTVATRVLEGTKSVLKGALKGEQPAAALGVRASVARNYATSSSGRSLEATGGSPGPGGLITSNFTVDAGGHVVDNHFARLYLP